jgi:hypothetical protein
MLSKPESNGSISRMVVITPSIPSIPSTADSAPPTPPMSDPTSPEHYQQGGIECIDAIRAALGTEGFRDYCAGNVHKYVWRHRHKNGIEDLKKAQVYLGWLVETFAP